MATITYTTKFAGTLTNPTSVILTNSDSTIGIKRNDTGAVVVAAGSALTNTSTGTYVYTFTPPSEAVFYTSYIQIIASGRTLYHETIFYVGINEVEMIVPSAVVADYVIETLSLFTNVTSLSTWPLYRSTLPDDDSLSDNIAAIYDISADLKTKQMDGGFVQRYGIRFAVRAKDYDTGYQKAKNLLNSVQTTHAASVTVGGTTFIIDNFSSTTGVESLGVEKGSKQRYIFTTDFLVTIKEQ